MTSRVHRMQSVSAVFYPFFYHLPSVTVVNVIASYEYQKNECVQQWNLFKCQTSTFYFSTYRPHLFEYLLIHAGQTIWETRLLRSLDQSLKQHIGQVFFINNTFSSTSKLLTPNMYCWSCKTLVTIYWTHLRVNGIWATSFAQRKWITERCSLQDAFSGIVAIFISDKWRHLL